MTDPDAGIRIRRYDAADHDIVAQRDFPVPRDVLYAAFAHPLTLARWWGPRGAVNRFEAFELYPGGEWRFVMQLPDGTEYPMHHEFVEVDTPNRVVFRHHQEGHGFRMELTFRDIGPRQSRLEWRMRFDSADEARRVRAIVAAANEQNLDRLGELLAGAGHVA